MSKRMIDADAFNILIAWIKENYELVYCDGSDYRSQCIEITELMWKINELATPINKGDDND